MNENQNYIARKANHVVVSVNPIAGPVSSQNRVVRSLELLHRHGLQCDVFTNLGEAVNRARELHNRGHLRVLVGVGGDGTAAELVNRTAEGLPITLLPAGNENLLARFFGLGRSPEELCKAVIQGKIQRIDAGKAGNRIFLLMIGCGFDAEVVLRVHERRKGHIRSRNYFKPILETIRNYKYPAMQAYLDEQAGESALPLDASWLFVFNLPCYGGGLRLAPWADGSDGLLDLCCFRQGSLQHGLRYAAAVLLGRHRGMADFITRRVRRLRITSEREVPYQLDGDPAGTLPIEVESLPGRLTLVVPE